MAGLSAAQTVHPLQQEDHFLFPALMSSADELATVALHERQAIQKAGPSGGIRSLTPGSTERSFRETGRRFSSGAGSLDEAEAPDKWKEGKGGFLLHRVSRFDTLAGLAVKYGVEVEELKRANRLTSDLQMFALGEVRIPTSGCNPQRSGSVTPTTPPAGASTPVGQHGRSSSREVVDSSISPAPGGRGPGRKGEAAAAAVAAGREAAAAAVQLVENIDPELLLGVRGLRTTAELEAAAKATEEGAGGERGSNAVALLLALQQHSTTRANSLGIGLGEDNPLQRLALSSSSDALEEERPGVANAARGRGRRSVPLPERHELHSQEQRSSGGGQSSSFWEHEFSGEDNLMRVKNHDPGGGRSEASATSSMFPESSLASLVGLTGEKLTMRRRGQGTSGGRGMHGDDSSGISSGEEQEGPGWFSADEYVGSRADASHRALGTGRSTNFNFAAIKGWTPTGQGAAMDRVGSSASRNGSVRPSSIGSASFESLDTVSAPATVAAAAQWGTRVFDDFLLQLRRSGGWLLDRAPREAHDPSGPAGRSASPSRKGEIGIDLQVMARSTNLGTHVRVSPVYHLAEPMPKEFSTRGSAAATGTLRRSSRGKTAMD